MRPFSLFIRKEIQDIMCRQGGVLWISILYGRCLQIMFI